jgi:hypothetical protein
VTPDVGVAEHFLNDGQGDALLQGDGGRGVPHRAGAGVWDACGGEDV